MGEVANAFITKFHNLEGVTVAEKKRNLFNLFHDNCSLRENKPLLDSITSQLTPQTHLERIFAVEFLIYYRRLQELSEEFLKGDEIIVSKISKQSWFFQSAFKEIGAEFVNRVIPTLSFSLRLKILKRMVPILNEQQANEIFDALLNQYGVFMATNLLTSCSSDKIEQILRSYPIKLWTSQLKLLYAKNPDLIYLYLSERVKQEGDSKFMNSDPLFAFIAAKNPQMFCNLQEEYNFAHCRIGKRSTKRIVRAEKAKIVAKPDLYVNNLNAARLVRNLGPDFDKVYLKLFPRETDSVWYYSLAGQLLKCYPKKGQFRLFKNTFDQVFHKTLEASHDLIKEELLQMISDAEEREKWAKLQFERDEKDLFLKFFKAPNCIKIMKRRFKASSEIGTRVENISTIVESCLINKDMEALRTACAFLSRRFKNDDKRLFIKFLEIISSSSIFDHLDENHWDYIKRIVARREFETELEFDATPIRLRYVEFLYKNKKPIEEGIKSIQGSNWVDHLNDLDRTNRLSEKTILSIFLELAPQLKRESDTIEKIDIELVAACKKYNKRNPTEPIDVFENVRVVASIKAALADEDMAQDHRFSSVLEWMICRRTRTEEIEELTLLYWANFEKIAKPFGIKWFLRHRPQLVVDNTEKFIVAYYALDFWLRRETNSIWRTIKCYSHLGIDRKSIDYCIDKLHDDGYTEKTDLVPPLSIMMAPEDYVKLVEAYKPVSHVVDLLNAHTNQHYQLQRHALRGFVNLNAPDLVLPVLRQFLKGDYVRSCITPLYSTLYRIPQNRLQIILQELCNTGAVSVKKHGFYFTCVVFDEAAIFASLTSCHLTQALAMSYQHFVKNPSEEAWTIYLNKLAKLDKNDHFTNLLLVNTPAPKGYKSRFFEATFDAFRKQFNRFTNVLLDKVQKDTVGELPTRFFETIKDEFLAMTKSDLIFSYHLICCSDNEKFGVIFDALRTFKQKHWSFRSYEGREKLHKFIDTFFNAYMAWKGRDEGLIVNFLAGFQEIFTPVEAFEEFVVVSLMRFKDLKVADLSRAVVDLNNSLVARYGKLTVDIFADCLNKVLRKFCKTDAELLELCYSVCNLKQSIDDALLVVRLLPKTEPQLRDCAQFYYGTMDLLRQVEHEAVKVHLNLLY